MADFGKQHRMNLGVIPAQAGIHVRPVKKAWIPAFAGMTPM
jgi:hypothetical protein